MLAGLCGRLCGRLCGGLVRPRSPRALGAQHTACAGPGFWEGLSVGAVLGDHRESSGLGHMPGARTGPLQRGPFAGHNCCYLPPRLCLTTFMARSCLQAHYDDLKAEHDETRQKLDKCRQELEAARSEARAAAEQASMQALGKCWCNLCLL